MANGGLGATAWGGRAGQIYGRAQVSISVRRVAGARVGSYQTLLGGGERKEETEAGERGEDTTKSSWRNCTISPYIFCNNQRLINPLGKDGNRN